MDAKNASDHYVRIANHVGASSLLAVELVGNAHDTMNTTLERNWRVSDARRTNEYRRGLFYSELLELILVSLLSG